MITHHVFVVTPIDIERPSRLAHRPHGRRRATDPCRRAAASWWAIANALAERFPPSAFVFHAPPWRRVSVWQAADGVPLNAAELFAGNFPGFTARSAFL